MKTVLIAVSDPIVRTGVASILGDTEDLQAVGEVGSVEAVRDAVARLNPDVVVLDVAFRRCDPALVPELARISPACNVLVLVDHAGEDCPLRGLVARGQARLSNAALDALDECCLVSLRSGARGCLPKAAERDQVLAAVRTVAGGEIAAAPWLAAMLPGDRQRRRRGGPSELGPLTARELEVTALIAQGLSNKDVARRLGIGVQTVKNHLERIKQKLGVESRLRIGLFAVKHHLTTVKGDQSA